MALATGVNEPAASAVPLTGATLKLRSDKEGFAKSETQNNTFGEQIQSCALKSSGCAETRERGLRPPSGRGQGRGRGFTLVARRENENAGESSPRRTLPAA